MQIVTFGIKIVKAFKILSQNLLQIWSITRQWAENKHYNSA